MSIHARTIAWGIPSSHAMCEIHDKQRVDPPVKYPDKELTEDKYHITCRACVEVLGGNPTFFDQRLRWQKAPDTTKRVL